MGDKQRGRTGRMTGFDRRGFLVKLGAGLTVAGGAISAVSTGSFSSVTATRKSAIDVATDGNGIVGIVGYGPVQKNKREAMAEFSNNGSETLDITVALDICSDPNDNTLLYDNEGGSGCSVSFSLGSGNSQFVDIEAENTGTYNYSVSVSSPNFSLDTTGSVESQAGNVKGAVWLKDPSKDNHFTANPGGIFEVDKVDIQDNDNDDDLDKIEYRVRESGASGTLVGSKDVTPPVDEYKRNQSNPEEIQPDSGHNIQSGTTYALTVTAYDADGNFSSATVEDTA